MTLRLHVMLTCHHCIARSFVAEGLGEPSSGRILTEAAASGATDLLPVSDCLSSNEGLSESRAWPLSRAFVLTC